MLINPPKPFNTNGGKKGDIQGMSNFNISKKKPSSEKHYRAPHRTLQLGKMSIVIAIAVSIIWAIFPSAVSWLDVLTIDAIITMITDFLNGHILEIIKAFLLASPIVLIVIVYLQFLGFENDQILEIVFKVIVTFVTVRRHSNH